jgi:hypothetical protein
MFVAYLQWETYLFCQFIFPPSSFRIHLLSYNAAILPRAVSCPPRGSSWLAPTCVGLFCLPHIEKELSPTYRERGRMENELTKGDRVPVVNMQQLFVTMDLLAGWLETRIEFSYNFDTLLKVYESGWHNIESLWIGVSLYSFKNYIISVVSNCSYIKPSFETAVASTTAI